MCGDSVFIVSDEQGKADEFGVETSTEQNPDRNLYWMAKEEFEDISYKAIALLCKWREDIAEEMAQRAATGVSPDRELVDLGNVVFMLALDPLERALVKDYGAEWASRYKKAWVKHPVNLSGYRAAQQRHAADAQLVCLSCKT